MSLVLNSGWLFLLALLLLAAFSPRSRTSSIAVFSGMLFLSGLALPLSLSENIEQTFWLPIQSKRSELFLLFGLTGTLSVFLTFTSRVRFDLPLTSIAYIATLFYGAVLRGYHDGGSVLFEGVIFAFATTLPLSLWARSFLQLPSHVAVVQRVILLVNAVTILFVLVQLVQDASMLTLGNGNRFRGLLSNPQHAGAKYAMFAASAVWIAVYDKKRFFVPALAVLAVDCVLLLWSGSRTGIAMFLIASGIISYPRLGRQAIYLPIFVGTGIIAYRLISAQLGFDISTDRLTEAGDTRSEAWRTLISQGANNPIFGVGVSGAEKSENGWLYGFASYGLGMLVLQLIWTLLAIREVLLLLRERNSASSQLRPALFYSVGVIAAYFAGAIFEGYLISRVSTPLVAVFFAFSLAHLVRTASRVPKKSMNRPTHQVYRYENYGV